MATTGEPGTEGGAVSQPAGAQPVKVRLTDPEVLDGFRTIDLPVIKLLENVLEKGACQAFG